MNKKVLIVVLTLLLCIALPSAAFAGSSISFGREVDTPYAVEGGNIYFNEEKGTVTDCDESVTRANIPDKINGITVTGLDCSYWYLEGAENANLVSITLPASVNDILFNIYTNFTGDKNSF